MASKVLRIRCSLACTSTWMVTSSGMWFPSMRARRNSYSVSEAEGNPTSISFTPMSTRVWNSSSFSSTFMGSISAWLPSRRSTEHQMGALVICLSGQDRCSILRGTKGMYFSCAGFMKIPPVLGVRYEKTPLTNHLVRGVCLRGTTLLPPPVAHAALMASNKAAAGNVAVTVRPTAHGSGGRLRDQDTRGLPHRFAPTTGSLPGRGRAFFPSSPVLGCCFNYSIRPAGLCQGKRLPVGEGRRFDGKGGGEFCKIHVNSH